MSWQIVSLADVPPSRWKNGGGRTQELVAWPNTTDWRWRMSVAEVVQDGPFSHFDGVQRWFAVLSGQGVALAFGPRAGLPTPAHTQRLTPASAPLCFAGDLPVQCTLLDGPTQDFNLMLRPGSAHPAMMRLSGPYSSRLEATKIIAVYPINTGARVQFDHEVLNLNPDTLAWRSCPAGTALQVHAAHALWIEMDA